MIEYLLPTGASAETRDYSARFSSQMEIHRFGLLANGFPGGDVFLRHLAEAISALKPNAEFRHEIKGNTNQLSAGISEPLLTDMANECDAIIVAWGHCGSCTSGVTRDAIAFTDRGIPSVLLICEIFWDYSEWIARALGMINIPRVRLPYPVAGTGNESQRALARQVAPEILLKLARQ